MSDKLVSICIPVYNGSNFLRNAIESALAQSYPHVEIIVVNDGSTDDGKTETIARSFGNRIRYFYQKNRGVAGALNTAIENAKGKYFAWLSHDDVHLPQKTSAQIDFLDRLDRPDACLFSDYELINEHDELISRVILPAERIRKSPRLPLLNGYINGCSLLIPMHLLREFGKFDETLRYTQDYDLWNKILDKHEFFHQPEVLIRYRIHTAQDTQTAKVGPESNPLWKRMIDDRSATQRAQIAGSSFRFYKSIGDFLQPTPMMEASTYALNKAQNTALTTLTSIIIPFYNEVPLVHRAIASVKAQIGAEIEIIVVNDGSTEDISTLERAAEIDSRIKLIHQPNRGVATARNTGLKFARGEYIAFLDADDAFLPHKINRQQELMQEYGALFSHTSYYVSYPGRKKTLGLMKSGQLTGACYPNLISSCSIAAPTVMIHRAILDEGFAFPAEYRIGEDLLAWIDLSTKYLLLGIDEPLSVIEWAETSAALSLEEQILGLTDVLKLLSNHPIHGKHTLQLKELRVYLENTLKEQSSYSSAGWGDAIVDHAWNTTSCISPQKIGRLQ